MRRLVASCDDLGLALSAGCMLGLELGLLQGVFNFDRACVWTTAVWALGRVDIGLKPLVAFVPPRISDDLGQIKSEEKRGGKKRGNERGIGEKTFIYVCRFLLLQVW